jgi:hypothetical protein
MNLLIILILLYVLAERTINNYSSGVIKKPFNVKGRQAPPPPRFKQQDDSNNLNKK